MLAELVVCLSHRYCCKASSPFREVLMNLRVLILIIPACVLVSVLQLFVLRMELHRPLILGALEVHRFTSTPKVPVHSLYLEGNSPIHPAFW
eukprot:g25638.t1